MGSRPLGRSDRFVLAFVLAASSASAHALRDITPGELALTPAFCQDVQAINGWTKEKGTRSPRAEHWLGLMGETFWAMHHYCWGLVNMQRSRAAGITPEVRAFYRRTAINEYEYVLRNSPPDFVMLPEVYYRIGESYVALGEHPFALLAFAKARSLKPDYWPAYSAAGESLLMMGQNDEARRIVQQGLEQVPDNPQLLRIAERVGKLKFGAASAPRP